MPYDAYLGQSLAQYMQPYLTQVANKAQQVGAPAGAANDPANLMGAPPGPGGPPNPANAMGAPQSPAQQQNATMGTRLNQWLSKHGAPQGGSAGSWDDLMTPRGSPSDADSAVEAYFNGSLKRY